MRLELLLNPTTDIVWKPKNQYKMRGVLYKAIKNTKFDKLHSDATTPSFCFSNVYPTTGYTKPNEPISENTKSKLLIDSPHPGVLDTINSFFESNQTIEIGDNQFNVIGTEKNNPDVGPIGTQGTIKTQTGLYLKLDPEDQDRFNLDINPQHRVSWTPEAGTTAFKQKVLENSLWKLNTLLISNNRPEKFNDLFDSYNVKTVYKAQVNVSKNHTRTFLPSVVSLKYTIKSPKQREWLNTLVETGLGNRNSLGFGFLNII